MPTSVNATTGTTGASTDVTTASTTLTQAMNGLGKQEFLQLLVAQLRNQDPLSPMEDKEFISELAQFTTLETMQSLDKRLETLTQAQLLAQGATLLGREIEAAAADGSTVSGKVTEVQLASGTVQLVVGGQTVPVTQVTRVKGDPSS
ncbi:MAG TPA: flagellar hook capping FlgD N-terminal domain-containing protein [Chloroflexota bacterium]|nr:flagellar hook capping FlgD N-terminal domain-containing protein [Chloroflexota bacterium]